MNHNTREFIADFETTVYSGQDHTEVWAAAIVEMYTDNVYVYNTIDKFFQHLNDSFCHCIVWFHNLKFDGVFIMDYLLRKLKLKQAYTCEDPEDFETYEFPKLHEMKNNTFQYLISADGLWYSITIKHKGWIIEFRDSLKLMPLSVKAIGQAFKTKHQKLSMEYEGERHAGGTITSEEESYIKNDVLVVKEAMEIFRSEGHTKSTIGGCCMSDYKNILKKSMNVPMEFRELYPNVYEQEIDEQVYGVSTEGDFVRRSYKGGWCYCADDRQKVYKKGLVADVNSLYPSVMHSASGNVYPIGKGCFWTGDYIDENAFGKDRYYFIKVRTRFYLKPGKLPCIQIKNNALYKATEWLKTSDIYYQGEYYESYLDEDGIEREAIPEMTFTCTDWKLVREHYDLVDCEIIGGVWYYAMKGIFDDYIDHYAEIKQREKGGKRTIAKLFLNNLYGRFAQSTDSSFKVAQLVNDRVAFITIPQHKKRPGYIPIGSAITSYAREFTIRRAQMNYYGNDKPGFRYGDTDSLHCVDMDISDLKGIDIHPTKFLCWKIEAKFDQALYVRQKTNIERHIEQDGEVLDKPVYKITCAGLPQSCKNLLIHSMEGTKPDDMDPDEKKFLRKHRVIRDFKPGLKIPGKLRPKILPGGIVLERSIFTMKECMSYEKRNNRNWKPLRCSQECF